MMRTGPHVVRVRVVRMALAGIGMPTFVAQALAQAPVAFPSGDGGTVDADLHGNGRHALILVPGGRFDKVSWASQAATFVDAGYRVLAISHRGRGETRAGTAGPDAKTADSSWTVGGEPLPFVPFDTSLGAGSLIELYRHSLRQQSAVEAAGIPVEAGLAQLLLLSSARDEVWPASEMAAAICQRMIDHDAGDRCRHDDYDDVGHLRNARPPR